MVYVMDSLLALGLVLLASLVDSLAISYCSPDNTGAAFSGRYNQYQSNGACQVTCQSSYAFAIIQGSMCWCSNYIPAHQVSSLSCNQDCPGFGDEWCGSTSAGLFGYFALNISPSGTAGGSSSAASTTQPSSSVSATITPGSSSPISSFDFSSRSIRTSQASFSDTWVTMNSLRSFVKTVMSTVEPYLTNHLLSSSAPVTSSSQEQTSTFATSAAPASIQPSSSPSPSPSSSPSSAPSPGSSAPPSYSSSAPSASYSVPSLESTAAPASALAPAPAPTSAYTSIITVTGQVKTILVTPSATATADSSLGQGSSNRGGGLSKGTVVGIVVGSALAVGLGVSGLVWFYLRRKHARATGDGSSNYGGGTFTRDSQLDPSNNLPSRQVSQMSSAGLLASNKTPRVQTSGMASSGSGRSPDTTIPSPGDRRSLGTDQRLNPYALYAHDESRHSNISLQDNQDYSRQLKVANPDFE